MLETRDRLARASLVAGEWRFDDSLALDPLAAAFADAVQTAALRLHWTAALGRHAVAARDLERGELVMMAPAAAMVATADSSWSAAAVAAIPGAAEVGLDADVLALARAVLESGRHERVGHALLSHREHVAPGHLALWHQAARVLCAVLPPARAAEEDAVVELLLAIKANAHRVLDSDTASRAVGLGLFPAACMLNHACVPAAVLHFRDGGRMLHARTLVALPAGSAVTYSYLAEEHLCSPYAERARLLLAAHHFSPARSPQLEAVETQPAADRAAVEALARRVRAAAQRVEAAEAEGDADDLRAATERLRELVHGGDGRAAAAGPAPAGGVAALVEPGHWLLHDSGAALLAAARALDDAGLIARSALQLAQCREAALPRGTPHLATLYAAHAGALSRLLKAGRVPPPARADAAAQVAAALTAAARIRTTCLGPDHPLTLSTLAAAGRATTRTDASRPGG